MNPAEQLEQMTAEFAKRSGLADWSRYLWYHTIDLGNGLVTPGQYDYRDTVEQFGFPDDMRGMTVLDVGSATGYFAFEFEKRGARVVSVELPSLRDLDRFPGQDVEQSLRKIERMMPGGESSPSYSEREMHWYLLEGPFRFCHEKLSSRVARCYSTIYDLTLERTGVREGFDLVFLGDVLIHTLYPLKALAALAPLCRGDLIFGGVLPEGPQEPPAMMYIGGGDPAVDEVAWWHPNLSCLIGILRKLGFAQAQQTGWHRGTMRPTGYQFERAVIRASRRP
jgi:tRNA (mo5U34)-methyltransferase